MRITVLDARHRGREYVKSSGHVFVILAPESGEVTFPHPREFPASCADYPDAGKWEAAVGHSARYLPNVFSAHRMRLISFAIILGGGGRACTGPWRGPREGMRGA